MNTSTVLLSCVAVALGAAGCGSTSQKELVHMGASIHYRYTTQLARQVLPGGAVEIAATSYVYLGKTYFGLRTSTEESGSSKPAPLGGITMTSVAKSASLEPLMLHVERSCLGGHRFALAYGLLDEPQTHVVAADTNTGTAVQFHRVTIPARFYRPGGTLVYRLLEDNATTVITRTADGRVLSREPYEPVDGARCSG